MKEISLKKPVEKLEKSSIAESPRESYPSFTIYDKAPEELMKFEMGQEFTAKIKMSSKETHEGSKTRQSIGFDVLSVMVDETAKKEVFKQGSKSRLVDKNA